MCRKDVTKCDSEGRKINPTALLSISFIYNGVYNIPQMPSIVGWLECRLYSDKAV